LNIIIFSFLALGLRRFVETVGKIMVVGTEVWNIDKERHVWRDSRRYWDTYDPRRVHLR